MIRLTEVTAKSNSPQHVYERFDIYILPGASLPIPNSVSDLRNNAHRRLGVRTTGAKLDENEV